MSFLKHIFFNSDPNPLSSEKYHVEFTRASTESNIQSSWFNRVITFPFDVLKRVYNTYLLIRHAELREPASKNVCPMRWINSFSSLFFTMKITTIPSVMKAILKHPRKDPEKGLFDDTENAKVFLPLLKDMFPSEEVSEDDFLLTCNKDKVDLYRKPILDFMGPKNIKKNGPELQNIVNETVDFWGQKSQEGIINATEFSLAFTTTVISRLLLDNSRSFETHRDIATAIDYLNKHIMKKTWRQPISKEEEEQYIKSLATVRQAIETSYEKPALGSFVDTLKKGDMSELQVKTTLFLMYFGGSETAASLLNYFLWQLGQHTEYQDKIIQEMREKEGELYEVATNLKSVDKQFAESIRLFTPAYVMGRQPSSDLVCTVKDKQNNVVFCEGIAKKVGLLCAPTFAGRDSSQYDSPDKFNPNRFEKSSKTFSWLPFGYGKHSCPGQWLATAEIKLFIALLIQQYKIESFPKKEIGQKGYITLKPAEDVLLTLTKRKNN